MKRNVNVFGISDKRGRLETCPDPYLPPQGLKPAVCEHCHAVYHQKSWHQDAKMFALLHDDPQTPQILCPACQKQNENFPTGILTLQGDYLWEHETEIRNILNNRADSMHSRNPLQRIMRMEKTGHQLVIETTDSKLAEHMGRALQHAHRGELRIDWAGKQTCRVDWQRGE